MTYDFKNLDEVTRNLMLEELQNDINNGEFYIGSRIKEGFENRYLDLFERIIAEGKNEDDFANSIKTSNFLKEQENITVKGVLKTRKVPRNAAELLAHSEFNRYYMRALCRRAMNENSSLVVYRAKQVSQPDENSQKIINKMVRPEILLEVLKNLQSSRESFKGDIESHLGNPNSGLCVRLV